MQSIAEMIAEAKATPDSEAFKPAKRAKAKAEKLEPVAREPVDVAPMPQGTPRNRENWLQALAGEFRPLFLEQGATIPDKVRIAIGFTSTGRKSKRIGECWSDDASADGTFEIFIRPDLAEPMEVAAILAHELVHASVGLAAGHGKPFKALAIAIGLEGKMRATTASEAFKLRLEPILADLGPLPHAKLGIGASSGPKKQTNRQLKCECPECGYIARTSAAWLETAGPPICPLDMVPMIAA